MKNIAVKPLPVKRDSMRSSFGSRQSRNIDLKKLTLFLADDHKKSVQRQESRAGTRQKKRPIDENNS